MAILTSITVGMVLAMSGATAPPVEDTHWVIESVTDSAGTTPIPATPEAYVEMTGGEITGFTGCNWISGYAAVGDGTVALTEMGTTKRGCSNYPEWLEMRMQWVLDDGELTAVVDGDTLTLTRPEGRSLTLRAADLP
ncbi:META domain-containing protein [Phytohabitans sp. LJ34]|uniref:META domain-containing protein n=1 Tax=Phytohabitans sp. LJ34 TaxID=3452217 RepID=UPI003F88DEC2